MFSLPALCTFEVTPSIDVPNFKRHLIIDGGTTCKLNTIVHGRSPKRACAFQHRLGQRRTSVSKQSRSAPSGARQASVCEADAAEETWLVFASGLTSFCYDVPCIKPTSTELESLTGIIWSPSTICCQPGKFLETHQKGICDATAGCWRIFLISAERLCSVENNDESAQFDHVYSSA
jgi:hypothetical protein